MELLITFLIFLVILIGLFYLVKFLPDPTLQTVARVILVVGALLWLVTHLRQLVHAVAAG